MLKIKIVQIASAPNGVMALGDDGEMYFGFWLAMSENEVPKFIWRKIPKPSGNEFRFEVGADEAGKNAPTKMAVAKQ